MSEGIIYITRTPQDLPNYYKVGRTSQSTTEQRTRHEQTYISGGIKTIREFQVSDDVQAERAAHSALADTKVDLPHANEIFNLDIDFLIAKVKSAIRPWLIGEVQNNSQNNWILDFLSQPDFRIANYYHNDLEINQRISLIIELMMRVLARGDSVAERLIENKPYEDLINDSKIGIYLETSLKNIDHLSLVQIDNWHKKFEVILYLSKAPLINPISRDGYQRALNERNTYNLKSGLNDFNINKVINYWSENYFSSNSKLIIGCLDFLDHQVPKWNSHEQQLEDIFIRGAKNSVYINAMNYCINHPDRNSKKVFEITNQKIWDNHGADWLYENLGRELSIKFDNVREIIWADDKKYRDSLWDKAEEKKLPVSLCSRVANEKISLDEAIKIYKKVSETQWVQEKKKGERFYMEGENIVRLEEIYQGTLSLDQALEQNRKLEEQKKTEEEYKKKFEDLRTDYQLDNDFMADRQLKLVQNTLFKIFKSIKEKDIGIIKELNLSKKITALITLSMEIHEKDYLGVRFHDHGELGFSYISRGSLKAAFSYKKNQYVIWNNTFRKKNIKTYIEQEEFINEFLLNMNVEN